MPYIKKDNRLAMDKVVEIFEKAVKSGGDLSRILVNYVKKKKLFEPNYNAYKNYIGELNECAAEVIRRFKVKGEKPVKWAGKTVMMKDYKKFKEVMDTIVETGIQPDGHLNYVLFAFYVRYHEALKINARTYAKRLEGITRRVRKLLAKYEDEKIAINGDVV